MENDKYKNNNTTLLESLESEYRSNNSADVKRINNILSRDSNLLLYSIENCNFDNIIANKLMLRRKIKNDFVYIDSKLNQTKGFAEVSKEIEKLNDLINDKGFSEKMLNDNIFFKYIYNHPLLIWHNKYEYIKEKYKESNSNILNARMKDNRHFKPDTTTQMLYESMPVPSDDDEDAEFDEDEDYIDDGDDDDYNGGYDDVDDDYID
jgi:hypothetical protein